MSESLVRRVATLPLTIGALVWTTTAPAAAAVDSLGCSPPESMQPLFALLDSLTQLAFIGGVGLGVLGFSIAGALFTLPGEEYNRRAKVLAKSTLIGVVILLSADMVVGFLISQLGGAVC